MNLEYPTHRFLVQIQAEFDPLGGVSVDTTRIGGIETAQFLWNPTLEHGLLFYNWAKDCSPPSWSPASPATSAFSTACRRMNVISPF
jgi:hypothetical protein